MLWPYHRTRHLPLIAVRQGLHEVRVHRAAVGARHLVAVVAEEVEAVRGAQDRLTAGVALEQRDNNH